METFVKPVQPPLVFSKMTATTIKCSCFGRYRHIRESSSTAATKLRFLCLLHFTRIVECQFRKLQPPLAVLHQHPPSLAPQLLLTLQRPSSHIQRFRSTPYCGSRLSCCLITTGCRYRPVSWVGACFFSLHSYCGLKPTPLQET